MTFYTKKTDPVFEKWESFVINWRKVQGIKTEQKRKWMMILQPYTVARNTEHNEQRDATVSGVSF